MAVADDLFLFDLRGFIVLKQVLGPSELQELNRLLEHNSQRKPGQELASQVFEDFLLWGKAFRDLVAHERIIPLLHNLIDDRIRLDRYYCLRMRPGTTGVPLHGGAKEVDLTEQYAAGDGRIRCGITTVSWALTDMLASQGGFACIPGSHKSSLRRPASLAEEGTCLHVPLRAGDVLVFTSALAHRGSEWTGPHERRALLFKYAPVHLAWSRAYLSWRPDLIEQLTPEQRVLFQPPHCFEGSGIGVG